MASIRLQPKIVRSLRKTMAMKVLPDSTLVVKVPMFLPKFMVDSFILNNQGWIDRQLAKIESKQSKKREFQEGEVFLYLGKELTLKLGDYSSLRVENELLLLPEFKSFRASQEITDWYIRQAKEIISKQVDFYAKQMRVSYGQIHFSDTKSKWGSCTHDNRLQFNWRLIMAPIFTINYVVIHELVHTLEKNHSRAFWSKVRLHNPSYKQQIKWLKANEERLML